MQVIRGSHSILWEPRLTHMLDWADQQLALLRPNYEGRWDIWFVRLYPTGTSWHARPIGARCATIHASTPEELVTAIREQDPLCKG